MPEGCCTVFGFVIASCKGSLSRIREKVCTSLVAKFLSAQAAASGKATYKVTVYTADARGAGTMPGP